MARLSWIRSCAYLVSGVSDAKSIEISSSERGNCPMLYLESVDDYVFEYRSVKSIDPFFYNQYHRYEVYLKIGFVASGPQTASSY